MQLKESKVVPLEDGDRLGASGRPKAKSCKIEITAVGRATAGSLPCGAVQGSSSGAGVIKTNTTAKIARRAVN